MLIDHIAIRANDIHRLAKWYVKHLDAEITHMDLYYVRLSVTNTTIAIIDEVRYPHNHIGILVHNIDDLPSYGERVEHRDGTVGVYVEDPEGNFIEYIYYAKELKEKFVTYDDPEIIIKEE
jgi:catechol-2,3-dioxygenase